MKIWQVNNILVPTVASVALCFKVPILLLFIVVAPTAHKDFLFCHVALSVNSSFTIILQSKKEFVALF